MRLLGQSWAAVILSGGMLMGQVPQPQAQDAGGRGTSGAIQRRARPPARIMSFAAEPARHKCRRIGSAYLGYREPQWRHPRPWTWAGYSSRNDSSHACQDHDLYAFR